MKLVHRKEKEIFDRLLKKGFIFKEDYDAFLEHRTKELESNIQKNKEDSIKNLKSS